MSAARRRVDDSYPKSPPLGAREIPVHVAGVLVNATLVGTAMVWLIRNHAALDGAALAIVCGVAAGLFAADFFSGVLHWMFDTWFTENNRPLFRMVVMVREHHLVPKGIFKYPIYHDAGPLSWIASVLIAPVVVPITLGAPSAVGFAAVTACVVMSLGLVFMLEFHKRGHRPQRGPIRALQRLHLVLSPAHHSRHHRGAHDSHYCIINGWANPVLDKLRFWRAIEFVISWLTGAVPRQNDEVWRGRYWRSPAERNNRVR